MIQERNNDVDQFSKEGIQLNQGLWSIEEVLNDDHYRLFHQLFMDNLSSQAYWILCTLFPLFFCYMLLSVVGDDDDEAFHALCSDFYRQ